MSDGKLGIAILGAGIFVLEAHLPAILAASDSISIKAIYSRSPSSGKTLASHPSLPESYKSNPIPTYSGSIDSTSPDSLSELLKREDVKACIIALPIMNQVEVIRMCLKHGKSVLSEKPVGGDVTSARVLIEEYETTYKPKGIIWRVAENFAHEPGILFASSLLHPSTSPSEPGPLGPILSYELRSIGFVKRDHKYHGTDWRNIPSHQGGFLLDGGVHGAAALRVLLGDSAPTHVISYTSLHRSHLPPHDTITAIASKPSAAMNPDGGEVKVGEGLEVGKSYPSGLLFWTFASSDLPDGIPFTITIHCLNGLLTLSMIKGNWRTTISSSSSAVKDLLPTGSTEFKAQGVEVEVREWAEAILDSTSKGSGGGDAKVDNGTPKGAFWDLSLLEGCLTSGGKEVNIGKWNEF